MKCQFTAHNFQEILLFCFNKSCKKAQACQECIQTFHIQHIHDCFKLDEMEFILSNELEKVNSIANNDNQCFKIYAEQQINIIKQAIEQIKNNTQNKKNKVEIENIISITKQCYHHQIQHQILSFILQNFLNQPEIKSNLINQFEQIFCKNTLEYQQSRLAQQGYRLFELKKYKESFTFFNQAYILEYCEVNFIKIFCLVLFLINKKEKAQELIEKNQQFFYNNEDQSLQFSSFLLLETTDEYNQFNYFLSTNSPDPLTQQANLLLQLQQYDKCLEIVNQILKKNQYNQRAIEIKVEALLKQGKYGLAKEFINGNEKQNPQKFQSAKLICINYDREFFDDYRLQMLGRDQNKHIQQFSQFILQNDEMELKDLEKFEQYVKQQQLEQQPNGVLWKLFSDIKQKKLSGSNIKQPKFMKILSKFGNNDFDSAQTLVDELLIVLPLSRFLYFIKSRCFQKQNNYMCSLKFAKIAMYLGKEYSFYTRNYAFSLIVNNQVEEALKILDESKLKNEYNILKMKGQIFYQKQKFKEALECLEQMLNQQPNNPQAKTMIQQTQAKINRYSNGEQENKDSQLMKKYKNQNMSDQDLMEIQMEIKFDQILQLIMEQEWQLFYLE